jgi:hypothetical protein
MRNNRTWIVVAGALLLGGAAMFVVQRVRAAGIPETGALTYTAYLESPDGTPISGDKTIGLAIFDAESDGNEVCRVESSTVSVTAGRFQLALPDACRDGINANPDLWLEPRVDSTGLGRTKLGAVPYAIEASHATEADDSALLQGSPASAFTYAAGSGLALAAKTFSIAAAADFNANSYDTPTAVTPDVYAFCALTRVYVYIPENGLSCAVNPNGDGTWTLTAAKNADPSQYIECSMRCF